MYIYGASGHAKALIDLIEDSSLIKGVFDDDPNKLKVLEFRVFHSAMQNLPNDFPYVLGIGSNAIRKQIVTGKLMRMNFQTLHHGSAILSKSVKIGDGSVFMENTIVKVDTTIGNHVIINTASTVDHDCKIDDYAHIGPGATLCGGVSIGEGSMIGAKSVILPGVSIGRWCVVGAGSVVHKSIGDGLTWIGTSLK
ncbi:acetyltransferase [Belliella sp. DSM 107340]|uniref:Acetyltransferase n=1 Tax=Belliella calami TaxID=2923436 RepID=A0ABS9UNY5_9BACT|nr:acetyltransferase [Belliella calami]MCH7398328.1 acetyltransferase [Belliella calami]